MPAVDDISEPERYVSLLHCSGVQSVLKALLRVISAAWHPRLYG
jgi:hypothetical protein